jgi:hypothetical protein
LILPLGGVGGSERNEGFFFKFFNFWKIDSRPCFFLRATHLRSNFKILQLNKPHFYSTTISFFSYSSVSYIFSKNIRIFYKIWPPVPNWKNLFKRILILLFLHASFHRTNNNRRPETAAFSLPILVKKKKKKKWNNKWRRDLCCVFCCVCVRMNAAIVVSFIVGGCTSFRKCAACSTTYYFPSY